MRLLLLSVVLAGLSAGAAAAHPHVFIDAKIAVKFEAGVLQGIGFTWTFDKLFTNMILTDFSLKPSAAYSPAQVKTIKEGAFDNLENYHYFLAFELGKKKLPRFAIEDFTASTTADGRLVYAFFVPLKLSVAAEEQSVAVTVYDDTYYVAFTLLKLDDVDVQADATVSTALAIQKTSVKPEWPGQYMPDQLVVRFKEKQ